MIALDSYETKKAIRQGLSTMEFASLPAVIKTVQGLSRKVETLTADELGDLISKDPFALAKVYDLANRGQLRDSVSINNLNDAIVKVGFNKVRGIAYNLLDMESAKAKLRYHEQQQVAGHSLASCMLAEEIAKFAGNVSPQDAYTTTVLRGYGEVLISAFLVHYYREALALEKEVGRLKAFKQIFGITPIELTYDLLRDTKIPREFLRTLKPLDPEVLELQFISSLDERIILADFSEKLAELTFNHRAKADKYLEQTGELLESYNGKVLVTHNQVIRCVHTVAEEIKGLKGRYDVQALPDGLDQTLKARADEVDPPPPPPPPDDPDMPEDMDSRMKRTPEEIFELGVKELAWIISRKDTEMDTILERVLEIFVEGLNLQETILFYKEKNELEYRPRFGAGKMYEALKDKFVMSGQTDDMFGICLENRFDALLYDAQSSQYRDIVPAWVEAYKVNSILCLPMAVGVKMPYLLIFCARTNGTAIQLTESIVQSIVSLRYQMIRYRVGNASAPMTQTKRKKKGLDFRPFAQTARKILAKRKEAEKGIKSITF